ncbi:DUF2235 domain-containing protein [Bradyrhizobium sediminis]|uniref:DUF2235 domain-containing protein n=1 Tax=Bradyrhizobium sediminis TaxID=2840469 RepID=A0A975RT78_9BRAD|nr:DUF2235 domain-containing protein [Bradyrhizobium sediminis]QWG18703.1 DUF2235 domain-containing protein [Bradyrhizobium sediminis]
MTRHLICLIDGTWVSADTSVLNQTYSNIYKLGMLLSNYSKLGAVLEDNIIFYSRGLGAQGKKILRYTAGGFAAGLDEEIADVYVNLASNYQAGDKIYLFGFSRGAVIARAVAGIIGTVGLLKDRYINCYKDVWETYRSGDVPTDELAEKCYNDAGGIEFLGVFDTVYGGNDSKEKRLRRLGFHNDRLPGNIQHAVHIVSLDDRRTFFRPILWTTGSGKNGEQIWVPGVHSNIGGTYLHEFLGDVSLLAMVDRIRSKTRLAFYEEKLKALHSDVIESLDEMKVVISDEMESWLWKIARRASRVCDGRHLNQFLHPVVDVMQQQPVHYKGRRLEKYRLHPSFEQITRYSDFQFYPVPQS